MNTQFGSSGAMSRAHYGLVRKFEGAHSIEEAESILLDQVQAIRRQLGLSAKSSPKACRELLLLLLYCMNASETGAVSRTSLAFALPAAMNLAEAGSTIGEKRTGYMFCAEVMPRDHEMQLMLVNTIHKDINSQSIPRIGLALEVLINRPTLDVIPSVQQRLFDLLPHPSPSIRALAIHALRSLGGIHQPLLTSDSSPKKLFKCLSRGNGDAHAALPVVSELAVNGDIDVKRFINICLFGVRSATPTHTYTDFDIPVNLIRAQLRALSNLITSGRISSYEELLPVMIFIQATLREGLNNKVNSVILDCFVALSFIPATIITAFLSSNSDAPSTSESTRSSVHPVEIIKPFLSSRSTVDQLLFLLCLVQLPVSTWAGSKATSSSSPEPSTGSDKVASVTPSVLTEWEVDRIMSFLESADTSVRSLTVRLLHKVDPGILQGYYSQSLYSISPSSESGHQHQHVALRLLDVVQVITVSNRDGAGYARMLAEILERFDPPTWTEKRSGPKEVYSMSHVIESVLSTVHNSTRSFQVDVLVTMLSYFTKEIKDEASSELASLDSISLSTPVDKEEPQLIINQVHDCGLTFSLLFIAISCEYGQILDKVHIISIFCSLSKLLERYPRTMLESMLLCLTRFIPLIDWKDLELVGPAARNEVDRLKLSLNLEVKGSRLIRKRCMQFLEHYDTPSLLRERANADLSHSLPEFASLLKDLDHILRLQSSPRISVLSGISSVDNNALNALPAPMEKRARSAKLRYEAYDPPKPTPKLRESVLRRALSPTRQAMGVLIQEEHPMVDLKTRRGSGEVERSRSRESSSSRQKSGATKETVLEDEIELSHLNLSSQTVKAPDLISLDSPFISEGNISRDPSVDSLTNTHEAPYDDVPKTNAPTSSVSQSVRPTFDAIWKMMDASRTMRGWCELSVEDVIWRLQGLKMRMDVIPAGDLPFPDELKVALYMNLEEGQASSIPEGAIRLKEGDDGSCLWQLRYSKDELKERVQATLNVSVS